MPKYVFKRKLTEDKRKLIRKMWLEDDSLKLTNMRDLFGVDRGTIRYHLRDVVDFPRKKKVVNENKNNSKETNLVNKILVKEKIKKSKKSIPRRKVMMYKDYLRESNLRKKRLERENKKLKMRFLKKK